jgi:multicomponent Na+:H+ antiporter subunit E
MKEVSFSAKVGHFIVSWGILFLIWLAFTSTFQSQEVLVGAITTFLVVLFTLKYLDGCCNLSFLAPRRFFNIIKYVVVFIIEMIKANFDVARRVISPSLPINPGIVKIKTQLKTDYAKMVLANSITLTPGTLSVDIIDDYIYIHWIDVKSTDPEQAFKDIAETFEKILLKIFE